jgi:hypothetical protein
MKRLSVAEIVDLLKKAKTKNERAELLKTHDCPTLRGLLRMNLDTSLVLALPEGAPPYKPASDEGFDGASLRATHKLWYLFVEELSPQVKQYKREQIFIEMLESLIPQEAEILIEAKDRKLDLGVTKKLVNEVFPGLIRSEVKSNGKKESTSKNANTSHN